MFSEKEINRIARQSGFITIDNTPINGVNFLKLLLYNSEQDQNLSLKHLSLDIKNAQGNAVSKQGLDARFSPKSVRFIQTLFESYLQKINHMHTAGLASTWMDLFNRVLVKDGTRFDLPPAYASHFKGFGGSASKAGCCIQFEYDLKTGIITDLNLTSANVPDSKNAQLTKEDIQSGDLILRDLGYFRLNILEEMTKKKAYFISKLNTQTIVYSLKEGEYIPVNFNTLWQKMSIGITTEMAVYVGKEQKLPLRLVIERVPDSVYEERIRAKKKQAQKEGYNIGDEFRDKQHLNLYITNIEQAKLPALAIRNIYRLRWQIELTFKSWKSTYRIDNTHKMKYYRWLSLFYARMLLMLIHWQITHRVKTAKYKAENKLLSIDKCMKSMKLAAHKITALVGKKKAKMRTTLQELTLLIATNHDLERKNKRVSQAEIMEISYCKSDK